MGMMGFSALASVTACTSMAMMVWIFQELGGTKLFGFGGGVEAADEKVNNDGRKKPGFEKPFAIQKRGIFSFPKGLDVIQQTKSETRKTSTMEEAMSSSSSDPDWAWLPSHILDLIVEKLIPISDYIRFGAVCKHWQSVALNQKQHRLKSCRKQLPMLLSKTKDNTADLHSFTQGKTYYSFKLHEPFNKRFCGSSHGWLAYADYRSNVTLLNPFTRRTIRLPQVRVPSDDDTLEADTLDAFYSSHCSVLKVILSADPSLFPNDYEALITYEFGITILSHFKSGDDAWTHIGIERQVGEGLVYYKGQFLVTLERDEEILLIAVDVSSEQPFKPLLSWVFLPEDPDCRMELYLVESSGGDLLLVRKFYTHLHESWEMRFEVFKLFYAPEDPDRPQWVEIESIGRDALILGNNESMCVSALDFPMCQPNSIYYKTVGVFNLKNRNIESNDIIRRGTWILPTMA